MNTEDIDLLYNQEPVCPHCGEICGDAWEIDFNQSECAVVECGKCGKEYSICRDISVTYSTYKRDV